MIDIAEYRHEKEKSYFMLSAIFGVLAWLSILASSLGLALLVLPLLGAALWIAQQFFRAVIFGHAALVSPRQFPELHAMVEKAGKRLGMTELPHVFVLNGEGMINAMALKFVSGKYVVLYAGLVDLLLSNDQHDELMMVIGHELAHHAAGHTDGFKKLLIWPASFIPYLGMAYSRACEFTADRLGAIVTGNQEASKRALVALGVGSRHLRPDIEAFTRQELEIPSMFGFINEIYSTHPRLTRRVLELEAFAPRMPLLSQVDAALIGSPQIPGALAEQTRRYDGVDAK